MNMTRRSMVIILSLMLAITSLIWGHGTASAGPGGGTYYANSPASGVTGTALRKFVDSLPGLGFTNRNNLGQYIPVAVPDTTTYPGSDYYELGLKLYTQKMHSDLPKATKLRGYYQSNTTDATVKNVNQYLGPLIIGTRDRAVRVKFTNALPAGTAGNLPIPVDTSLMGAGLGPLGAPGGNYTENRATLHLHGGNSPWISDGTPHQWTAPAGEATPYKKGVSTRDVPDMPATADGQMTFYWTNQQSGRLMFFHDHAYGLTRLNVYAGEAAGYLLVDPVEEGLINSGVLPNLGGVYRYGVPLVIQDKTFVPANIVSKPATTVAAAVVGQDDKWDPVKWGQPGDLWFPHVYEPNQDPFSPAGANPFGRWDYGPWFWPPVIVDSAHTVLPEPTTTPEAFMDTPIVNGTAYPYLVVQPTVYRFRILNACNDRVLNLSLFYADPADPTGKEVKMVPAAINPAYPPDWPVDGRDGGVPDPATVGPNMIQIGTEGGLLPNPVVIPNRPIGFDYNRRNIVVLNTLYRALMLGPAERADVIVDFSGVPAGSKLILYNDAPAPNPAFDPRYDYYAGDPDQTTSGGAPSTMVGYGPNTRTIMQFQVAGTAGTPFNLPALQAALPTAFKNSQPVPVVPESQFNAAYGTTSGDLYAKIQDEQLIFTPIGGTVPSTIQFQNKAIQELWDPWGRMNATLGVELPFTNSVTQTTIPLGYAEPPTEVLLDGQPTIWKITHNGVDTHPVHFHLFNVQVLNRVGWDGAIRPVDDNELGWKETVRMNPLEDVIVALQPYNQTLPFALPTSSRMLDVTQPLGTPIATTLIQSPPVATTVPNAVLDFGFEYVWHCHILGHEENDFMRPIIFRVPTTVPAAPTGLTAILGGQTSGTITNAFKNEVILTWTDNTENLATYRVERAPVTGGGAGTIGAYAPLGTISFNPAFVIQYSDTTVNSNTRYAYRVFAFNRLGDSTQSNVVQITTPTWSKATALTVTPSKPSPHIMGTNVIFTAIATGPTASVVYHYRFSLTSGATTTIVQDYGTYNQWALADTTPIGTYILTVDVLSVGPSLPLPAPDKTTSLTYLVVVPNQPVITPNLVPGIYTGPTVTLTLTGNVPVSMYYTVNGAVPTTLSTKYTGPIAISTTTTLKYFGIDANGTASVVTTGTYAIHVPDLVAGILINNGAVSTNTTTVNLSLAASDPTGVATMQFSNDNLTYSPEEVYAPGKVWNLTPGADGVRTVYVKFRDNSLPTPGTLYSAISTTIVYDTVAPVTTVRPIAGTYSSFAAPLSVSFTTNEAAATYYTINGTTPTTASPRYIAPISVGANTTMKFLSVDLAGNAELVSSATWTFDVNDLLGSVLINGGAQHTNNTAVTLTLSAIDTAPSVTVDQMRFSNDGITFSSAETYTTTKAWTLSAGDGVKTVYAMFHDTSLGGGQWSAPFTANIVLMIGGPITTATPIPGVYSSVPLYVTLTPSNVFTTIYYTTNGSTPTSAVTPTSASSIYTVPIQILTTTTLKYFGVDIAGNAEAVNTATWTISASDMVSSVGINNGASRTNNGVVQLSLSAVDPFGVATMQFSNNGITYTAEETYATSKTWTLSAGDGLKTVYVKFRDATLPTGFLYSPVTANITLDTTAPVSSISPVPGDYSSPPVSVTLSSNEPSAIYYSLGSAPTTTASAVYAGPISLATTTTIHYFAVDLAGNANAVQSATYTMHTPDLVAAMSINNGAATTTTTVVTLKLNASDPVGVASMQFSNDGVNFTTEETYTTTKVWTLPLGDGLKTVYARFRDMTYTQQSGTTPGVLYPAITSTIMMDTTPPVITASPISGTYSANQVPVALTANEAATIYYTTDGSLPTTASTVYTAPISVTATTTIRYFAVDVAHNAGLVKSGIWTIVSVDLTAGISINSGAARTNSTSVILNLMANDPVGILGMQLSNDGITYAAEEAYVTSKPWRLSSGDGMKTVYVRFRDATLPSGFLYNPITASIVLDTVPPVTAATPVAAEYVSAPVSVTLKANEPAVIYYTIDGTTPTTASTVYSVPIVLSVAATIKYFAVDVAGNVEAVKAGAWTFETGADMVASVQINSGAAETNNAIVNLVLSASDPAGPVASMQFSNDGITYTVEEPYATAKAWTLAAGNGIKTVYARFRDATLPTGFLHNAVTASIILDTVAPVTVANPVTGDYINPPVLVTLTTIEPTTIYYTIDGSTPTKASVVYTGPISVSVDTTIKYFAEDPAGNVEAVKSGTWTIHVVDMTATASINNGAAATNSASVTLHLNAIDAQGISTMQFSNDGIIYTAEEPYATAKAWTLASGDGSKTVYVRFRDNALPTGELYPPVTTGIILDTVAPTTIASPVTGIYSAASITVSLSADETATIYYTTDGATPTAASAVYTGPQSLTATTTIKYFAVDPAGNAEVVKSSTWTFHASDMTATVVINNGAARTNSIAAALILSASDPATGIATMQFSNDGVNYTAEEPYATSKAWTLISGDGIKTVYVRFRDNTLPTGFLYSPVTASIVLDTSAPVTTASPISGEYSAGPVLVTLTANKPATIYYSTDGAAPTTASTVFTGPISVTVDTTIRYFAVDLAGNTETSKSGTWAIHALDLTGSIFINSGAVRTNNGIVTLSLSASDATGIATMRFSNDGINYSAEEVYATSKAWALSGGDGLKAVYVRFKDNSLPTGQLYAPFTASIILDTTAPGTTASPIQGSYTTATVPVVLSTSETATIYFTLDGSVPTTSSSAYTGPITIAAGTTTINYFAVDLAGNAETVKTGLWTTYPDGNLGNGGTVTDALRALQISAGIITATASDRLHGDVAPLVNGKPQPDGKIDIGDVLVILRKSMGLVSW